MEDMIIEGKNFNFDFVFGKAPIGILMVKNGLIIAINEVAQNVCGYKEKELLNKKPAFLSPETQPNGQKSSILVESYIKKTLELGKCIFDWVHKKKNGDTILQRVGLQSISSSENVLLIYWYDISNYKKFEIRFNTFVENTTWVFYVVDANYNVLYLSSSAELLIGKSKYKKYLEGNVNLFDILQFNYATKIVERNDNLIKKGIMTNSDITYKMNNSKGNTVTIRDQSFTYKDPTNKLLVGGIITDITEISNQREKIFEQRESLIDLTQKMTALRDPYTANHEKRVSQICEIVAKKLLLSENIIEHTVIAAKIHDIGKLSCPLDILNKPGKINDIEYLFIKQHVNIGVTLLREVNFDEDVIDIVSQHHERYDGSGYPAGLRDDDIRIEARILSISDAYEAMKTHRPYRPKRSDEYILNELINSKGKEFDAKLVDVLLELIQNNAFESVFLKNK